MTTPLSMRPGSVAFRLHEFFERNPEEELSYTDITAKFSCSDATAADAVSKLRQARVLESVHVIRLRAKGIAR